jgi:glycosyltransferase involved in cell wall biosynthesis
MKARPMAGESEPTRAPLLIALPHGLNVSGVTLWAVRLAGELVRAGRRAALLLHPEPPGQKRLDVELARGVEVIEPGLPPIESARGDLSPFIPHYRDAARSLASRAGPVILSPNMHGDCYGVAAALCLAEPELVRVVGMQHSDIEYDARVLGHYAPMIGRFMGVSLRIAATLRERLGPRSGDVVHMPYGVPIPPEGRPREPADGRPLRLLYTGRIEHAQKRVTALLAMSEDIARRGVAHELTLIGDGPAAAEIDRAIAGRTSVRRLAPASPSRLGAMLDQADLFVLASRYEGLSVSLLEAMAHGCVPVVARTESGAGEAIDEGITGEIADIGPDLDDAGAGRVMADAVVRAAGRGLPAMSRAARASAAERFGLAAYGARFASIMDELAATDPRPWPSDRACAFSAGDAGAGSGSVPPEGASRLRDVLASLAGRRILIHGAGQHTIQLGAVLASSPAAILGIVDDDPGRAGTSLWGWPILSPRDAAATGATDIVISSWMHERAIWNRRSAFEARGLTVHRLYDLEGGHVPLPVALDG